MVTEGLNRIQAAGSDPASGCGPTFEKRRAEKSSPSATKGASVKGSSGAGAPLPPGDEDPEKRGKGTQVSSKTLYKKGEVSVDVENPNPSARPGQIHIQDRTSKFYYDHVRRSFYDPRTGTLAPRRYQEMLRDPKILRAIDHGKKILGIS